MILFYFLTVPNKFEHPQKGDAIIYLRFHHRRQFSRGVERPEVRAGENPEGAKHFVIYVFSPASAGPTGHLKNEHDHRRGGGNKGLVVCLSRPLHDWNENPVRGQDYDGLKWLLYTEQL